MIGMSQPSARTRSTSAKYRSASKKNWVIGELGAGVGLGREHVGRRGRGRRLGVAVGERRDADAEVAEAAQQRDQLVGVAPDRRGAAPTARRARRAGRRAAPARCGRPASAYAPATWRSSATGRADAGEVADRGQVVSTAIRSVTRTRAVAGGAARAVGHRHERRGQRLELAQRLPELPLALVGLRREELEREHGSAAAQASAPRRVPGHVVATDSRSRCGAPRDPLGRCQRVPARPSVSSACAPISTSRLARPRSTPRTCASACARRLDDFLAAQVPRARRGQRRPRRPSSTPLTELLAGGKRLRPAFCYWGWRGAGGDDGPRDHRRPRPRSSCCRPAR